jgi:hypothetical protein
MQKLPLNVVLLLILTLYSCLQGKDIESTEIEALRNIAKIAAMENEEFKDVSLIPFVESGDFESPYLRRASGYINAETFKFMLLARYQYAGPFVCGYAVVKTGKHSVINKKGTEILTGFDNITLFDTECGEFVFALTEKYLDPSGYSFLPKNVNYQLYNLNTGNILIEEDIGPFAPGKSTSKIRFFSNYMFYGDTVYEIKDGGALEKTEIDIESLASIVIKERSLSINENNFHYYEGYSYNFDPYFKYVDTLDFNALLRNVPENMQIIEPGERRQHSQDGKPEYLIQPVNRDRIHPLKKNKLYYDVRLMNKKDGEGYTGLYDAEENTWTIPLMKTDVKKGDWNSTGFYGMGITGYEDWIGYTYCVYFEKTSRPDEGGNSYLVDIVYNIKERKESPLFAMHNGFITYLGLLEDY